MLFKAQPRVLVLLNKAQQQTHFIPRNHPNLLQFLFPILIRTANAITLAEDFISHVDTRIHSLHKGEHRCEILLINYTCKDDHQNKTVKRNYSGVFLTPKHTQFIIFDYKLSVWFSSNINFLFSFNQSTTSTPMTKHTQTHAFIIYRYTGRLPEEN